MDNDIAAAFARLEEWLSSEDASGYRHEKHKFERIPHHVYLYPNHGCDNSSYGSGPTFPAAVDAALTEWERQNG